ncbi:MAG: DNA methyltransferase [Candidatus Thorarchaeota archaeon]|jgi:adenine-specific DNA-methyltransferase
MKDWQNLLLYGDCLDAINKYGDMLLEQVRLIYIDPPFFSGTDYTLKSRSGADNKSAGILKEQDTYSDKWDGGLDEYLEFMKARLEAMKPLLREDGSLWVHLDWHVSHYVKVMLDEIFGYSNFVNEIVWRRTNSPKVQSRGFGSQHDVILIYAADASKFKINQIYRDHDEKSRRPYSYEDKRGKFRLIEIEAQGIQIESSLNGEGGKLPFSIERKSLKSGGKKTSSTPVRMVDTQRNSICQMCLGYLYPISGLIFLQYRVYLRRTLDFLLKNRNR